MPKKVLILAASPRKGGNSDLLCEEFATGARQAGHPVHVIRISEHRIAYCSGCGTCFEGKAPCPQRDDMEGILERMIAADVIVLATPVYFYTMAAQMKTLIDRCCARYTELTSKSFAFIATAADPSDSAISRTIEEFRGFLACLQDSRELGTVCGVGAWNKGDIAGSPAMAQARTLGAQI